MKYLANQIVDWLRTYAVNSGRKSWVVGVSGGVDSALVSTLCAMTGMPTHCVIMPCETGEDQTRRGDLHIDWLQGKFPNVRYHNIDITATFQEFEYEVVDKYSNTLAFANTKSRLRMIALYQVATCVDGLVVGTGNKVEDYGVGFFTKYGDGGVDISPIADLFKSEVRQMCSALGVMSELTNAVPTDGLWDDTRTDEDAIGATYEELEWAMRFSELIKDRGHSIEQCSPRELEVWDIYTKRHAATMHKLLPIPTFVRVPKPILE